MALSRAALAQDTTERGDPVDAHAAGGRRRSRRNHRFSCVGWARVETLLARRWSPEQVAGYLRRIGELPISHETTYRHVWSDRRRGGTLYQHLRGARKGRRKRYGAQDSRGRVAGRRHIRERPADCERRTHIGKLTARTTDAATPRAIDLIDRHRSRFVTITADNGTESHDYRTTEAATGVPFYFTTPYHAWERGTNENTTGLLRQYLSKRATPQASRLSNP